MPTFLFSQAPKTKSFFPHHLGDIWKYASYEPSTGLRDTSTMQVVTDSVLANGNYFVKISGSGSYIIDSVHNVYEITSNDTIKMYDFTAPIKNWWKFSQGFTMEVDTVFKTNFFGMSTMIRSFNIWYGDFNDPNNRFIFGTQYYAEGFGLVQADAYEAFYKTTYLIGAIIDSIRYGNIMTQVDYIDQIPNNYKLAQNYPNPFIASTNIRFFIPQKDKIALTIYNVFGQKVRTLVYQSSLAGEQSIIWNGKNDQGIYLPNGIYIYQLSGKNIRLSHKALLLK